ncbi:hypothetical protein HK104_007647 [Borealophlyctis nickersoniae]|nr:hypothetical protein HK104_007647 [Borealophlyctis nickersoniae]
MLLRRHRDRRPLLKNQIGALIISPTRELARQIYTVITTFVEAVNSASAAASGPDGEQDADGRDSSSRLPKLSHMLFIGGNSVQEDVQRFQKLGGQIVVGTPGRLDDLLKRTGMFDTRELEVLVLDEADRLLDMGFEQTLTSIISRLPKQRRTGLFSATMTDALNELVRAGLRNPVRVMVKVESVLGKEEQRTPSRYKLHFRSSVAKSMYQSLNSISLEIGYIICSPEKKLPQLLHYLRRDKDKKFIVYFSTCACVDYYYKILSSLPHLKGFTIHSLHGKMDPKRRVAVYKKFTTAPTSSILVCTDVAARGLDIPDVDWVIQFDPPQDPKSFAHRCGRTARLGREGKAVVFLSEKEDTYVEFLKIRKVPMAQHEPFPDDEQDASVEGPRIITADVIAAVKSLNTKDRDVYEKSIKGFVSWVRAYNEHQASYIFRFKDVDVAAVAHAFGLLRLPKMPELKTVKVAYETSDVNPNTIKYKDKAREKQRQSKLASAAATSSSSAKLKKPKRAKQEDTSWSHQKEAKERRAERREKREKKRVAIVKAKAEGRFVAKEKGKGEGGDGVELGKGGKRARDDGDSSDGADDWAEFKREKKAKKRGNEMEL